MKKFKFLSLFLLAFTFIISLASCNKTNDNSEDKFIDYTAQAKLSTDFTGKTFKADGIEEVKLSQCVDGDTIHVTDKSSELLKLRFISVDTPESTSAIEPWGKAASNFTKDKVTNCVSLVITSEDGLAGKNDSYGRWLAYVWYKSDANSEYRLLNLELVQESYSFSKVSTTDAFHDLFVNAADQARKGGLRIWGETDPDYCYSGPKEVSLMEIKKSLVEKGKESEYFNQKVVFDANVARYTQSVGYTYYLTDTDLDTGEIYSIQAYSISTGSGNLRKPNVRVRISGTIVYYDAAGIFQLTDIVDKTLSKDNYNLKIIEENSTVTPYEITDLSTLNTENSLLEYRLVTIKNLIVKSTYTTTTDESSNKGAITIYCELGGKSVTVRTVPIIDKSGKYLVDQNNVVLESNFKNKTIYVIGIVEKYNNKYQIKLLSMDDVVIH